MSRIMNLLDIPHFGQGAKITYCIKTLLSCVRGGYLWLDRKISIDFALIHRITGLPMEGEDPTSMFSDKHRDRDMAACVMMQYHTTIGVCDLKVALINVPTLRFGA